jgi:hypothetical protein
LSLALGIQYYDKMETRLEFENNPEKRMYDSQVLLLFVTWGVRHSDVFYE